MTHRIRRQILDLELPREEDAEELQRRASRLFREKVAPALERQFDAISRDDVYLRIDRLELDLGALPEDNWEQAFVEEVLRQVTGQIRDLYHRAAPSETLATFESDSRSAELVWEHFSGGSLGKTGRTPALKSLDTRLRTESIFLTFLRTGILPWYAGTESLEILEAQAREQIPALAPALRALFLQEPAAVKRLVFQFSPLFVSAVLEAVLKTPAGWIETFKKALENFEIPPLAGRKTTDPTEPGALIPSRRVMAVIMEKMIPAALSGAIPAPAKNTPAALLEWLFMLEPVILRNLLQGSPFAVKPRTGTGTPEVASSKPAIQEDMQEAASAAAPKPLPPAHEPARPAAAAPEKRPAHDPKKMPLPGEDFIMVENAGLVLLAPYLHAFFKINGLVEGTAFIGPAQQQQAIHLLHFLAEGAEQPEEQQLTFCKLLCAWPWEEPIEQEITLNDAEKAECERLLEAVITNWSVLKNASTGSLRANFLQRQGQLSRSDDNLSWRLRTERKSYDLLLDRLPWSISVVRLPWMTGMIQVEW